MKETLKTWMISAAFATMPLSIDADTANNYERNQVNHNTNISLFENLKNNENLILDRECVDYIKIDSKIIIDAVLNYFDEEVKKVTLSEESREKIVQVLNSYLNAHPVYRIDNNWELEFVIDNKREFSIVVKKLMTIVINDMSLLVRKVVIPLFLWWNDTIMKKLNNLDETVMEMKEKQYKDIVFDYVAWITKRVAKSLNWKMKVGDYYSDIVTYYPNKHSDNIKRELEILWIADKDIKSLKYPFN